MIASSLFNIFLFCGLSFILNRKSSLFSKLWGTLFGSTYRNIINISLSLLLPSNKEESDNGCSLLDVCKPCDWDRSSDDYTTWIVNLREIASSISYYYFINHRLKLPKNPKLSIYFHQKVSCSASY